MESTEREKKKNLWESRFILLTTQDCLLLVHTAGGLSLIWCGLCLCKSSYLHRGRVFWWHQAMTSPEPFCPGEIMSGASTLPE